MAQCPSCESENISFQREQNITGGASRTTYKVKGQHGIVYWLTIGWILEIFRWAVLICTFGLVGRKSKKQKVVGTTVNAQKTFNTTAAVCQNCGKSWKA